MPLAFSSFMTRTSSTATRWTWSQVHSRTAPETSSLTSSGSAFQVARLTVNSCTGIEWSMISGYLATSWKPMRWFIETVAQSAASTTPLSSAE